MFDVGFALTNFRLNTCCQGSSNLWKRFLRNVLNFSRDIFLELIKGTRLRISISPVLEIPPIKVNLREQGQVNRVATQRYRRKR